MLTDFVRIFFSLRCVCVCRSVYTCMLRLEDNIWLSSEMLLTS